jgi:hypothetical protein
MFNSSLKKNQSGFITNKIVLLALIALVGWALYKGYLKYRGPSATKIIHSIQK